jgi:hypothetical protein
MGKPSIFSNKYQRAMRKRKIIFRIIIIIVAFGAIFLAYNKSAVINFKKIAQDLRWPSDDKFQVNDQQTPGEDDEDKDIPEQTTDSSQNTQPAVQPEKKTVEEYVFKFPDGGDAVHIGYEDSGSEKRITGIRADDAGVSISIRDDGKAVVFDNPKTSDIWIYDVGGVPKKVNPDTYRQVGEDGLVFKKPDVMAEYENNYIWALKPLFLKDGRIIYQSNLPWFKTENNIYLWIAASDGSSRRLMDTGQRDYVKYQGFTQDGMPVIEIGGIKYSLNVDDGSRQKIN